VVVHNFDLMRAIVFPDKANAALIIHADAVLAFAVALQRFELIAGWNSQAREICRRVELQ